jgi:hypothetical protein
MRKCTHTNTTHPIPKPMTSTTAEHSHSAHAAFKQRETPQLSETIAAACNSPTCGTAAHVMQHRQATNHQRKLNAVLWHGKLQHTGMNDNHTLPIPCHEDPTLTLWRSLQQSTAETISHADLHVQVQSLAVPGCFIRRPCSMEAGMLTSI